MSLEELTPVESFLANLTSEGLLPCMTSHMPCKMSLEGQPADIATMRLDVSMRHQMALETAALGECLPAGFTRIRL